MNQDPVRVNRIDWLTVFPILNLWQAVRMGFRIRVLIPCWLGLLVVLVLQRRGLLPVGDVNRAMPWAMMSTLNDICAAVSPASFGSFSSAHDVSPLWQVPAVLAKWSQARISTAHAFYGMALHAMIIGLVGVAVARATAGEFCMQQRIGAVDSLRFSARRFRRTLLSVGVSVALTGLVFLPLVLAGWMESSPLASPVVMLLWLPLMIVSALAGVAAIVCCTAWLLSLGGIGTDDCAGADAASRGINYVLSRRLMAASCVAVVTVISLLAEFIAMILLRLSLVLMNSFVPTLMENARGGNHIGLFEGVMSWSMDLVVMLGPPTVQMGAFLSGITISYALLRQAEDAVHLREMNGGRAETAPVPARDSKDNKTV